MQGGMNYGAYRIYCFNYYLLATRKHLIESRLDGYIMKFMLGL